jgi:hypothetical protein
MKTSDPSFRILSAMLLKKDTTMCYLHPAFKRTQRMIISVSSLAGCLFLVLVRPQQNVHLSAHSGSMTLRSPVTSSVSQQRIVKTSVTRSKTLPSIPL